MAEESIDQQVQGAAQADGSGAVATDAPAEAGRKDADAAPAEDQAGPGGQAEPLSLPDFSQEGASEESAAPTIEMLRDVSLHVEIELGRTRMRVEDVLQLRPGSIVELDKLAGDPVDVFVNGRLVARGEVLVLNDNFCVRVSEIVASPSVPGGS